MKELVKSTIDHREPIIVEVFILQYAKLRMLELYYNFFDEFCDVNKFEELEMDTDSLYLALAEEDLDDCILPSKRAEWTEKAKQGLSRRFQSRCKTNFFPRTCCSLNIRNMTRENQDCSRKSSDAPKCYACVVKPIAVTIVKFKSISLAVKV